MTVVVKAKDRTGLRNCVAALCATWCEESMNEWMNEWKRALISVIQRHLTLSKYKHVYVHVMMHGLIITQGCNSIPPPHCPYTLPPPPPTLFYLYSYVDEVIRFDYLSLFQTQYPSTPQPQSSIFLLALSDVAVTLPRTTVGQTPAGVGTLCAVRGRPSYRTAPASGI